MPYSDDFYDMLHLLDGPKSGTTITEEISVGKKRHNQNRKSTTSVWKSSTKVVLPVCTHSGQQVTFANGVKVFATKSYQVPGWQPQYGLYADWMWTPRSVAFFIDWPDGGIPRNCIAAAQSILHAYELAEDNFDVEVGCIGAHGRTGTILACMAALADPNLLDPVEWVRENYCDQAVETLSQIEFIRWFLEYMRI